MSKHELRERRKLSPKALLLREYTSIFIGCTLVAISFNAFLLPNKIAPGGISGLSAVTLYAFGWEPAFVQWGFCIPLFIIGVLFLGKNFGLKTLIGTVFLPLAVYLTRHLGAATTDILLGALFGGVIAGLGLGLIFLGKASTGGTDVPAQILHKFTGLTIGTCIAIFDGVIVLLAIISFDIEAGLYAVICLFVISKTIDIVQVGLSRSKTVMILTNKEDAVRQAILEQVDRGLTRISARGGFTDQERPVLMVVVAQREFIHLKTVVHTIDENAFMIVMNAAEVIGVGFRRVEQ